MKKIVVVLSFLIVGSLMSQNVRFGVKGGLNVATLTNVKGADFKMGFHLGGISEFKITDELYAQPELLYSVQGVEIIDDKNRDKSIRLSYATIPIMAKYYIMGGFCVEVGPYVAFNLSSYQDRNVYAEEIDENISGLDYGVGLGINYILPNTLNFGLRYNYGVSEVFIDSEEAVKNGVICLSVGWFL